MHHTSMHIAHATPRASYIPHITHHVSHTHHTQIHCIPRSPSTAWLQVPILVITVNSKNAASRGVGVGGSMRTLAVVEGHSRSLMQYLCTQVRGPQGLGGT